MNNVLDVEYCNIQSFSSPGIGLLQVGVFCREPGLWAVAPGVGRAGSVCLRDGTGMGAVVLLGTCW